MSKTVAVVLIVKNEEALLARCLDSCKGADNYYILDTGSQDRTVEIARKYTDNVFLDFVWVDDFSAAQNFVKARVKEDIILSLDADEVLQCDFAEVRKAAELCRDTVKVKMVAEGDPDNTFGFPRLFRNCPEIYWVAAIHKHLNVPGDGEEVGNVVIQYGFSPAHHNDPDRSLRMLEHDVATNRGAVRNLYYLGREYWYKKRIAEAIVTLQRYVKASHWPAEEADAYLILSQAYYELLMVEEAAAAILQAIKINPDFKEAVEWMAHISSPVNRSQWVRMSRWASNRDLIWSRVPAEAPPNVWLISPHHDDESLFAAYTLMREKPNVVIVTSSHIQPNRGDLGCTDEIRQQETIAAMKIAECPVFFLGIKDTELTEDILIQRLNFFRPDKVYIPAIQGGNAQHDLVAKVCMQLFPNQYECYTTYSKTELYTTGKREIKPTADELEMKSRMLDCYDSQLSLRSTKPHFDAVRFQSEWML